MSLGINLVMTVIGFAVSIMFIVFVCTRLIWARLQMSAARRSFNGAAGSGPSILERGLHGVEHVILANIPTKKYSDAYFSSAANIQCAVCLADYQKDDTLRILPVCGHFFHASCIDIWLSQHSTCPVCRISLRELPERKRFIQPLFCSAIRANVLPAHPNAYDRPLNSHRLSSTHGNRGTAPAREECFHSEEDVVENAETNHVVIGGWQATEKSENKQVESPSST